MEKITVIVTWSISQALEWIKYTENPWEHPTCSETALFMQRQQEWNGKCSHCNCYKLRLPTNHTAGSPAVALDKNRPVQVPDSRTSLYTASKVNRARPSAEQECLRTLLELRRPRGPRCLGYSPNPLPPRSLKLLHGVQWQTPVRRARLQSHGRPR